MIKEGIFYSLINDNFSSVFRKIVMMNKARKEMESFVESLALDKKDPKFLEKIEEEYKNMNFRVRMGLKLSSDIVD